MIARRVSTVLGWMAAVGLVEERGDRFIGQRLPQGVELVDYGAPDEPLFPRGYDRSEYQNAPEA